MNVRKTFLRKIEDSVDAINERLKMMREVSSETVSEEECAIIERHAEHMEKTAFHFRYIIKD